MTTMKIFLCIMLVVILNEVKNPKIPMGSFAPLRMTNIVKLLTMVGKKSNENEEVHDAVPRKNIEKNYPQISQISQKIMKKSV